MVFNIFTQKKCKKTLIRPVNFIIPGMTASSTMPTTSAGYSAPRSHVTDGTTALRNSPLNVFVESYTPGQTSRSISPSSDDSDKWSSYLRAKDELIGQKDQIIDR